MNDSQTEAPPDVERHTSLFGSSLPTVPTSSSTRSSLSGAEWRDGRRSVFKVGDLRVGIPGALAILVVGATIGYLFGHQTAASPAALRSSDTVAQVTRSTSTTTASEDVAMRAADQECTEALEDPNFNIALRDCTGEQYERLRMTEAPDRVALSAVCRMPVMLPICSPTTTTP